ncbi:hypothetical protein ACWD25_41830 [Streptomyces sp. NPDC002920]
MTATEADKILSGGFARCASTGDPSTEGLGEGAFPLVTHGGKLSGRESAAAAGPAISIAGPAAFAPGATVRRSASVRRSTAPSDVLIESVPDRISPAGRTPEVSRW